MSIYFNDYQNIINEIDENINNILSHPHNNEILHPHKPFNNEKENYTQENGALSFLAKERKKIKEEERKNLGRTSAFESGINFNKPNNEDFIMKDIIKIVNNSIKDEEETMENILEKEKEETLGLLNERKTVFKTKQVKKTSN
jgi:hypothetical protein